jgi:hypothetical protein
MNASELYKSKLSDPRWQTLRDKVFTEFGRKCNRCKAATCLNIHHKTYTNGKEPWDYPLKNFEVLCDKCHAKEHGKELQDSFCDNPNCQTPKQPIRQCFKFCFRCSQKLLETLKAREIDNGKLREGLIKAEKSKEQVEELNKLVRKQESLLKEKIKAISELKQGLEDAPSNDAEIARYDELLTDYNAELEKAQNDLDEARGNLEKSTKQNTELKGEVEKDVSMRMILISLVLVVIGLLCFSIFAEDDKSKPAPAPTVIVEKDAPQLVEVFSLNNVDKFIGKFIEHESRVFGITVTSSGTVYINLGGKFPSQLMNLVIFKSSRNNVDKLPQAGDTISYAGVVEVYKGKPRIVIESGAQLTLIQRR